MISDRLSPDRLSNQITGVVTALVVDNKDPEKQGRIRIQFPALSEQQPEQWARVAVLMAGGQRGTLFLPEVGDEVLVAFEAGDPRRPYVIGALWNGKDAPPDANADGKNNLRMIKSRSGHIVRLDDTDGKEKIEIVDKSGKNSLSFDTSTNTITVTSDKDIVLQAKQGAIKLDAKQVEITASADASVSAKSGLKLESSGDTVLKGQTVNIN